MKFTSLQMEILTGLMLGDGGLEKAKAGRNACLRITRQQSDHKYNEYLAKIFANFNSKLKSNSYFDKRTQKEYFSSSLRTGVDEQFTKFWRKWYDEKTGVKRLPKKLKLTATIIAIWFADDGCLTQPSNGYYFKLATHCFTRAEVAFLMSLLTNRYGDIFHLVQDNSGKTPQWFISCYQKEHIKMIFRDIDLHFPEGMERKSNFWRDSAFKLYEIKNYPNCIFCNSTKVYIRKRLELNRKTNTFCCQHCLKCFKFTGSINHKIQKDYSNSPVWRLEASKRMKKLYNQETKERLAASKRTPKAIEKARQSALGSKNSRSKLTEDDVLKIRELYSSNAKTQSEIAIIFNTPLPTINHIIKRYTWKHV